MKCSKCKETLGDAGFVVTLVIGGTRVLTATVHLSCMQEMVGRSGERQLEKLCLMAGWTQTKLPFERVGGSS